MTLFDRREAAPDENVLAGPDNAGAKALSVAVVENDFVAGVYEKLASVYDLTFGPALHRGRMQAIARMGILPDDRILEVGVGTGINLPLYPASTEVTGIDFSASMLEKAHTRVQRQGVFNARLLVMDAANLRFADESFDIVYAPYLISVVPDPVKVAQEMRRVCRTGGRIIFLNHFRSENPVMSWAERLISPLTVHVGFKSDLDLRGLLAQASLEPVSIEKVNIPRIWSLVTCLKS